MKVVGDAGVRVTWKNDSTNKLKTLGGNSLGKIHVQKRVFAAWGLAQKNKSSELGKDKRDRDLCKKITQQKILPEQPIKRKFIQKRVKRLTSK